MADIDSQQTGAAGCWRDQTQQRPDCRALSGTVRSYVTEKLPLRNLQVLFLNAFAFSVILGQIARFNGVHPLTPLQIRVFALVYHSTRDTSN